MPKDVIKVTAFFRDKELGNEEFQKGTNVSHIMTELIRKYGQVASFVINVPPVIEEK